MDNFVGLWDEIRITRLSDSSTERGTNFMSILLLRSL